MGEILVDRGSLFGRHVYSQRAASLSLSLAHGDGKFQRDSEFFVFRPNGFHDTIYHNTIKLKVLYCFSS
jgi:hypothetical protein